MSFTESDFLTILPVIALSAGGILVMLLGLLLNRISRHVLLAVAVGSLAITAGIIHRLWGSNFTAFGGMVTGDNFALVFTGMFILGALLSILLAYNEHESQYLLYSEFLTITLFATVGMVLMASTTNLLILFLGLETLSISLYVLAALKREDGKSLEAAFKYFLLGAFSSAFLLYGIAFVFGAGGSLDLAVITTSTSLSNPFMLLGGILILVGLGFKVAIFPFHMWVPDVYEGAPTPIAAFMSTGSKAAGFAAMLRVLFSSANGTSPDWGTLFWILAVLTMFAGNIMALVQKNVKRMLAYSSIAHAGYILIGITAWSELGAASVVFYLLSYTFMNIGAFGVISYLGRKDKELLELDDLKGLAYQKPLLAVVMAVFMFSLAGLPPTGGFVGKFYVFSAAIKVGGSLVPLVILGVINSMISVYYYLGVVVYMFMRDSDSVLGKGRVSPLVSVSLLVAVIGTLWLGINPSVAMTTFEQLVNGII